MTQKLQVIYITGLGSGDKKGQRLAVKAWRLYGVRPQFCDMQWGDGETWDDKFQRLLKLIDDSPEPVALVSVSAGATAAINAYAARKDKISGIAIVAGWINYPQDVGPYYRKRNPAFLVSAEQVPSSLAKLKPQDRQHILSIYALKDEVISSPHSHVAGAHNKRSLSIGHFITIFWQITFGAPVILRFLSKQG